jgi:hypothetical protein
MEAEVRFSTWKECFETLPDPRVVGRTRHRLIDLLFLTLCGVICGMDDVEAIEEWGDARLDWLRRVVTLEHGIASHDTLARVFAALDSKQFEACFVTWIGTLCPSLAGEMVAMDGKTVRGGTTDAVASRPSIGSVRLSAAMASRWGNGRQQNTPMKSPPCRN